MAAATGAMDGGNSDGLGKGHVLEEFKEIKEVKSLIDGLKNTYNNLTARETTCERFTFIIDEYQEQPHLIDPFIESLMNQIIDIVRKPDNPPLLTQEAFKYLYLITKMRGFKIMVRHFPHEVSDVEPVIAMLTAQDPSDRETWETRYMLILWLSMVCMIPFDMARLDSNVAMSSGDKKKPVVDRILDLAKTYLTVTDKCRDAAAYLVSRFCTRPDVKKQRLPDYLDWALQTLHKAEFDTMAGINKVNGMLTMLALMFKHGKREDLLQYALMVMKVLEALKLKDKNDTLLRKMGIKVTQRLGLIFLKQRVARWRYQRGNRSLAENLTEGYVPNTSQSNSQSEEEEEEYDIPEELEDVIEYLLSGLKDKDTIVRWSAAKGLGRITGRLPKELADEVVGSVLELFTLQETDGAWHGGCLTLAELGRRGLLLPQRLDNVVPVVLRALDYDEKRGNFSVGAHVRDAACYVCWSFARAYDPQEIVSYVEDIANALVKVSIFDREVNVRRAASAAFQENVGRQGTFPHGIDILTTADYFAVGNRTQCYLELSVFVAQFPEYTLSMIDHLVDKKLNHWDSVIRELAAKALNRLTHKAPQHMIETVLPKILPWTTGFDLFLRHGAILAVSEIIFALSKVGSEKNKSIADMIDSSLIDVMKDIVKKLNGAKQFRGLGGEFMRKAVTCMIEKLSLAKVPLHGDPVIDLWQGVIDDCLRHLEPEIQNAAAAAIPAFFTENYMNESGKAKPEEQEKIVERYLKELKGSVETTRMGFSLAIGALPKFFICGKLKEILDSLITATHITEKEKKWAEFRRDAVKALAGVCTTVGVNSTGSPSEVLCKENVPQVYDALLLAMKDYTLDSRGDVGAWVRESAMSALEKVTSLLVVSDSSLLTCDICENVFKVLVQQCCEKIDRTRAHAGSVFASLLYHKPEIPHVPHRSELERIFPESKIEGINWAAPSDTFAKFTQLLKWDTYLYNTLLGLTVSVGGLTESLVMHSSTSLHMYLRSINKDTNLLSHFTNVMLQIFKDHQKDDRVSFPMLKMLDQLLSKGCFDIFVSDSSNQFSLQVLNLAKTEISRSGDPNKILSAADVYCGLLQFEATTRSKSLFQLLLLICHKYPRVRKLTANKLYEALVTYDDIVPDENMEEITSIISETSWDEELTKVRLLRNQLCDLMNVSRPVLKTQQGANK